VPIILQDTTRQLLSTDFVVRELDLIRVKGKQQPSRIYELLGSKDHPVSPNLRTAMSHFETGLEAYRRRDFAPAIAEFQKCLDLTDDRPARLFLERCRRLKEMPPDRNWDGVWEMTSK
jgi:adenylate cyclase